MSRWRALVDQARRELLLDSDSGEASPALGAPAEDFAYDRRKAILHVYEVCACWAEAEEAYRAPLSRFGDGGYGGRHEPEFPGDRLRAWDRREQFKDARKQCREAVIGLAMQHGIFAEAEVAWDLFWRHPLREERPSHARKEPPLLGL